jgi:hypothetical protein
MRGAVRSGVIGGAALLAAWQVVAQEDLATRVKKAQEAARANAASAEGRQWIERNSHGTDRLMILVLNRCLTDQTGDIPTAFSVYVRLSSGGHAREIVTDLDESVGTCMTGAARDLPFAEPPRDDYWIEVNMAALL